MWPRSAAGIVGTTGRESGTRNGSPAVPPDARPRSGVTSSRGARGGAGSATPMSPHGGGRRRPDAAGGPSLEGRRHVTGASLITFARDAGRAWLGSQEERPGVAPVPTGARRSAWTTNRDRPRSGFSVRSTCAARTGSSTSAVATPPPAPGAAPAVAARRHGVGLDRRCPRTRSAPPRAQISTRRARGSGRRGPSAPCRRPRRRRAGCAPRACAAPPAPGCGPWPARRRRARR